MVEAFELFRQDEVVTQAKNLGEKMMSENGAEEGVKSFHRNLPLPDMLCEVSVFNNLTSQLARVYCVSCGLKMCEEVDRVVHRPGGGRKSHVRVPFRPVKWGMGAPSDILDEIARVDHNGRDKVIEEANNNSQHMIARPVKGGRILVEEFKHKPEEAEGSTHLGRKFSYLLYSKRPKPTDDTRNVIKEEDIAIDVDSLTESDASIETAYSRALKFLRLWESIDTDGSRNVDEAELTKFLTDKSDAKEWLSLMVMH